MAHHTSTSRRTVHQVQEMYAALGLSVCDDESAIKAACQLQRGTRNRELNSTKGSVAARAQQWFDDANALFNNRDELLSIVFEEFCGLADAVLRSDMDGGRTVLGPDTQVSLREIAMSWCRARADLAKAWLTRYLELRGLRDCATIEQPSPICSFKAISHGTRVMLTWTAPNAHYDEVRIVRVSDNDLEATGKAVVYQGADSSFIDTNVTPQTPYTYRAYSIFQEHCGLTAAVASTHGKKANPTKGKIFLVAALILGGSLGLLAYDHHMGDNLILSRLSRSAEQVASAWSDSSHRTPSVAVAVKVEATPAHESTQEPEALETPTLGGAQNEAAEKALRPPRAWMTDPPTLAFAGESLSIQLDTTESLEPNLVDARLNGVELTRIEFESSPPTVRFMVDPLPGNLSERQASWSFRLATPDGRLTRAITGTCQVLR
ncbi:MAG: hypothetical protein P8N09_00490 [Planctomycetota bacterium]|nr:hypothetical protein [Planctomycetota bacterium]